MIICIFFFLFILLTITWRQIIHIRSVIAIFLHVFLFVAFWLRVVCYIILHLFNWHFNPLVFIQSYMWPHLNPAVLLPLFLLTFIWHWILTHSHLSPLCFTLAHLSSYIFTPVDLMPLFYPLRFIYTCKSPLFQYRSVLTFLYTRSIVAASFDTCSFVAALFRFRSFVTTFFCSFKFLAAFIIRDILFMDKNNQFVSIAQLCCFSSHVHLSPVFRHDQLSPYFWLAFFSFVDLLWFTD